MDINRLPEKPTIKYVRVPFIDRVFLGDHYSIETTSTIPDIGPVVCGSVYATRVYKGEIDRAVNKIAAERKTKPKNVFKELKRGVTITIPS